MLYERIQKAQKNDQSAMLELIEVFMPLLKKYTWKLRHEDAYQELTLFFIELIKGIDLERLRDRSDGVIVSYVNISITHIYQKLLTRFIRQKKEILFSSLTDEQLYYLESLQCYQDERDIFLELGIESILNENECRVLHLIYNQGYSAAEIARNIGKSRQAVNQLKQRALKKLKLKTFPDTPEN